ncbi:sugar phosphate nucleotidyltransferase [Paenibacillus segetis]|uniref:Mannose-1-phosphate guanylyltransferase n=1 Tax=Paenibacillus segetis TaxID=1325360 RepID=A0ABQ1Y8Z9_9BACL|nr:sugar phosphate nucleotidyltransferase [Paenibacillus segetis]GGH15812.1 mannose-1-phosphate guanylyltransferase [Paenibacillus segetis]
MKDTMHIVFLCGGSGTRLWPLSNEIRSKLFLEILPSPHGERESMIGRVYRQLTASGLQESAIFVTSQEQSHLIARYAGSQPPLIIEPFRRGTFAATALTAAYLIAHKMAELDDIICITPADMFVGEDYFSRFKLLPKILKAAKADLALLGTKPTTPSVQYGYIVPDLNKGKTSLEYFNVSSFLEKPDVGRAKVLMGQKALWNCGVFAFPLQIILSYMEKINLPTDYEELLSIYENLPIRSFDNEVAERITNSIVLPYTGEWSDLGSWASLTEQLDVKVIGRGEISGESSNTHLVNELPYSIHVIDVPDIIVAASLEGVLISKKSSANKIKELRSDITISPKYNETSWGSYQVIDCSQDEQNSNINTSKMTVLPHHHIAPQIQHGSHKVWTILTGTGEMVLDNNLYHVRSGDVYTIPVGSQYSLTAIDKLELMEVQFGSQ